MATMSIAVDSFRLIGEFVRLETITREEEEEDWWCTCVSDRFLLLAWPNIVLFVRKMAVTLTCVPPMGELCEKHVPLFLVRFTESHIDFVQNSVAPSSRIPLE